MWWPGCATSVSSASCGPSTARRNRRLGGSKKRPVFVSFVQLRVAIDGRGLRVVAWLLGVPFKRIPLEHLHAVASTDLHPGEWSGVAGANGSCPDGPRCSSVPGPGCSSPRPMTSSSRSLWTRPRRPRRFLLASLGRSPQPHRGDRMNGDLIPYLRVWVPAVAICMVLLRWD